MDTDVLLYIDNRFDSMQKAQNEVNIRLFDKLDEIKKTSDLTFQQTTYTNGRVTKIENNHSNCKGMEAMDYINKTKSKEEIKETKSYKIGDFLVNLAATSLTASAIIGLILMILK